MRKASSPPKSSSDEVPSVSSSDSPRRKEGVSLSCARMSSSVPAATAANMVFSGVLASDTSSLQVEKSPWCSKRLKDNCHDGGKLDMFSTAKEDLSSCTPIQFHVVLDLFRAGSLSLSSLLCLVAAADFFGPRLACAKPFHWCRLSRHDDGCSRMSSPRASVVVNWCASDFMVVNNITRGCRNKTDKTVWIFLCETKRNVSIVDLLLCPSTW